MDSLFDIEPRIDTRNKHRDRDHGKRRNQKECREREEKMKGRFEQKLSNKDTRIAEENARRTEARWL